MGGVCGCGSAFGDGRRAGIVLRRKEDGFWVLAGREIGMAGRVEVKERKPGPSRRAEAGKNAAGDGSDSAVVADLKQRVALLSSWGAAWDDYDAPPPTARAIGLGTAWICSLHQAAIDASKPWFDPLITASEEGEIVFDWWRGEKRLTVYVNERGATYSRLWGTPPSLQTDDSEVDKHAEQLRLWQWLVD